MNVSTVFLIAQAVIVSAQDSVCEMNSTDNIDKNDVTHCGMLIWQEPGCERHQDHIEIPADTICMQLKNDHRSRSFELKRQFPPDEPEPEPYIQASFWVDESYCRGPPNTVEVWDVMDECFDMEPPWLITRKGEQIMFRSRTLKCDLPGGP